MKTISKADCAVLRLLPLDRSWITFGAPETGVNRPPGVSPQAWDRIFRSYSPDLGGYLVEFKDAEGVRSFRLTERGQIIARRTE